MVRATLSEIKELYREELDQRDKYCEKLRAGFKPDDILTEYWYCFNEWWECSLKTYHDMAKMCQKRYISHVYDIGCCYPFQHKIFKHYGIDYTGIEVCKYIKLKGVHMIHRKYPFKINTGNWMHSAAISNLCVGYLITDVKAYEQIKQDFSCLIVGSIPKEEKRKIRDAYGWF